MATYRSSVQEIDLASYNTLDATEIGYFVVEASRGTKLPRKISSEFEAIEFLGKPSSTYDEVMEVIEYVKTAPAWICAPYFSDAKFGGVASKVDGFHALTAGIPDLTNLDFDEFPVRDLVDTGDGSTVTFTTTLTNLPYVNVSLTKLILIDSDDVETEYTVTPSNVATEVLTASVLDTGSQLVRSTGALTLVFDTAPASGTEIYVQYAYDCDDIRFILTPISPSATWLKAKLISRTSGADGIYTVDLQEIDDNSNVAYVGRYEFSLTETKKNDAGRPVYIGKVFEEDMYLTYVVNTNYAGAHTAITTEGSYTNLASGKRGSAITATERNLSWDYAKKKNTYSADLLVDTSGLASCIAKIYDLVTTYQLYKAFGVVTMPFGEASATAIIATKAGYSINTDQMAFYCNWGRVENPYVSGTYFWTSLVGRDARNMAKMSPVFNSLAPAGTNDGNYGGELGTGIKELEHEFTDIVGGELQALDDARLNPHVYDPKYGYMTYGDRTAITTNTDTSFIGTRRLLNLIIYQTVNDILRDQEFKFNDRYRRQLFESKFTIMIDPILRGDANHPDGYCTYLAGLADDDRINTTSILQQRKFKAVIVFQATPTSEKTELEVIRLPQGEVNVNTIL